MLDELDNVFDDHPSLDASLEDFESNSNAHRIPLFGMPSQHSGFRSEDSDDELTDPAHDRWSPPGLRGHDIVQGSAWYRGQPYAPPADIHARRFELKPTPGTNMSPSMSREPSPQYEDALEGPAKGRAKELASLDATAAANIPLPMESDTPMTGRSPSPCVQKNQRNETRLGSHDDDTGFKTENLSNCRHSRSGVATHGSRGLSLCWIFDH